MYTLKVSDFEQVSGLLAQLSKGLDPRVGFAADRAIGTLKWWLDQKTYVVDPYARERIEKTIARYQAGEINPFQIPQEAFMNLDLELGHPLYGKRVEIEEDLANAALNSESGGLRLPLPNYETGKPAVFDAFHGSGAIIQKFMEKFLGSGTGAPSAREAFFFARNPATSTRYAERARSPSFRDEHGGEARFVMLDWLYGKADESIERRLESMDESTRADFEALKNKFNNAEGAKAGILRDRLVDILDTVQEQPIRNVVMARVYMENPMVIDQKGERYRETKYYDAIIKAKREGHDGVIFLNTFDGGPQDVIYAVFNNNQISQRFNPERAANQAFPARAKQADLTTDLGFDEAAWFEKQSNDWDAMSPSEQAKYNNDFVEFLVEKEQALIEGRFDNFDKLTPEQQSITMADFRLQEALSRNPNLFDDANLEAEIKRGNYVMPDGSVVRASESGSIRAYKSAMIDFDEIKNPVLREVTKFIWKQIEKRIGGMQVMAFTRDQIDRMFPSREPGEVAGFYNRFGSTDFIVLDRDQLNNPNYVTSTLIHEAVHGMTVLGLDTNKQFFNSLKAIADQVRAKMAGKTEADLFPGGDPTVNLLEEYGFEDMYEFIAEAFGNPLFQKMLAQTTLTPELAKQLGLKSGMVRTLWDAIVNTVRQLLDLPPNMHTALEGVLRVTERAARAQTSVAPDQQFKPRGYYPKFQTSSAAARAAQGFADAVKDVGPTSIGKRKALLAVSTLDQIRQWYRGSFVNAEGKDVLETLVSNIQRIRPFADDKREGGEKVAQRFIDFSRANPEAANEFADIANTVTMLNAQLFGENKHWGTDRRDSWQARALLPDLQRRFNAMAKKAPDAAKLYNDMVSYYRDMQNEITRQLVDNILAEHDAALSEADRASLTTKVMKGNLDDAARKLLANDTIFNALKDARQLRVIEGDYFPLMRHGEFVVQTRDSVGDLHGGVEVEPGVIEFTGKTESDALKMAENFAKRETKGQGFTKDDGVPLVLSGPTAVEMPSDTTDFKFRIKVQLDGVHMFDTQAEAESFISSEKGKFAQISEAPLLKRDDGNFGGEFSNSSLAAIAKSISARENIPQVQREMMLTALKQAAVRHMAGNRVQKRALPRRGFVGASSDLARNTLVYAEAATRYLGKLKYMPTVREAFSEMQKIVDAAKYSKEHQMLDQVLNHMRKRVDGNVIGEKEASPFVRDVLTMSSIDKLASPAYSLIQTLQPTMMTLPYLSGRYGIGDAGAALARAYSTIGAGGAISGGLFNTKQAVTQFAKTALDSTDVLGSIMAKVANEPDGKELTQLLNELVERGILDKNAGIEVAEVITKGRGKWAMGLSKVDRITRQLPAAIEQVNRAVSAVAAYRLAVANGASQQKAMSMAFDTVVNTQGDYSASNAPEVFNHPIWRISLQFKKYAQMYYGMFGDMLYRAFKDASPEERAVARRQLAHVVGVQILAAGALGVPGVEVIKIAMMAAGALGFGGGYDDFEREVRKSLADMTGSKVAGELITKGILPRALGLDLSTRLGADSLLTFGEPKKYDETNAGAYLFNTFVGAPGSLIADQFKAARGFADAIREGDPSQAWKSAELLPLPKVISDTAKAARKAYEGQTSSKSGRQTEEPIGLGTAAINAFGLRTADQAEKGAAKGAQIAESQRRRDDRGAMSKLKNQFAEAKNEGERVRVLAKLKELNAKLPEDDRQTPAQFKAFAKKFQQDKAKGLVTGGARFRNDAERQASEKASEIYNYAR